LKYLSEIGARNRGRIMSHFSLGNATNLLRKCEFDIDLLRKCNSDPDFGYKLVDIVVTLNHLCEWYLKDEKVSDDKKFECLSRFNSYSLEANTPRFIRKLFARMNTPPEIDTDQRIIRQLCNGVKHFKPTISTIERPNFICLAGDSRMQCGESMAQAGNWDRQRYYVEVDGSEVDVEMLVQRQMEKWKIFLDVNSNAPGAEQSHLVTPSAEIPSKPVEKQRLS
jgi:hypothetical protein